MDASARQDAARLGFPVQVLGRTGIRSHDARRWKSKPHLRVSLDYLRDLFAYLDEQDIRMYRMASGLAPYATHPDHPAFHNQLAECASALDETGALARRLGLRLSFHPSQYIVLNTPDDDLLARSIADVEVQAAILEMMGLGEEAVVVIHIGGTYGDAERARARFVRNIERLSPVARRRLVLENDDQRFGVEDVLWVHERCGIRAVYDVHHHRCLGASEMGEADATRAMLATWAGWQARPKVHFSSPRTDWGYRHGSDGERRPPNWRAHAEFADPFAFAAFYRTVAGARPDVMLELRAKDVALLHLRRDLVRYAPDLAACFGLGPEPG